MKFLIYITSTTFLLILIFAIYGHYNFEINKTESLPAGIYHICRNNVISRNDIVVFCPPYNDFFKFAEKQGYWGGLELVCSNQTPKYMKKAVGIPGDNIVINLSGVYINNNKIKNSEPYQKILTDKIFHNYSKNITLKDNEYFLMSDYNRLSYDSRYFGIITKQDILYKVKPFILFNIKINK